MDHLEDCNEPGMQSSQNVDGNHQNQPIIVSNLSGEVRIQLEGSHTTASETESDLIRATKDVKFEDELKESSVDNPPEAKSTEDRVMQELSSSHIPTYLCRDVETCQSPTLTDLEEMDYAKSQRQNRQPELELKKPQKENQEITEHFKQIMDMFDAFTKNLESLELLHLPSVTMLPNIDLLCGEDKDKTLTSCCDGKERTIVRANLEGKDKNDFLDTPVQRSMATITSGQDLPSQTIQCQTSFHEDLSIGQSSMITISACTSASALQHSLNNYANAGNALTCHSAEEGHPLMKAKPQSVTKAPITPAMPVEEPPPTPPFHTIHIEATSSPSSSVMQRPPLCQRLWDAITDLCAAICLCLQVNRDCIICLGFFAAFVVSASFLTAFFYRTLSMSPPLFQYPPLRISQDEGIIDSFELAVPTRKFKPVF